LAAPVIFAYGRGKGKKSRNQESEIRNQTGNFKPFDALRLLTPSLKLQCAGRAGIKL
jgi:hypothetical protein